MPASEDTLQLFVDHLAQQGLAHISIKVYLSAVPNLHVAARLQFAQQLIPWLEPVLHGIKKDRAPHCSWLLITLKIMVKTKHTLLCSTSEYKHIIHAVLYFSCFSGAANSLCRLRVHAYDPEVHLLLLDVAVDDRLSPTAFQITIKQSKLTPCTKGWNSTWVKRKQRCEGIFGFLSF